MLSQTCTRNCCWLTRSQVTFVSLISNEMNEWARNLFVSEDIPATDINIQPCSIVSYRVGDRGGSYGREVMKYPNPIVYLFSFCITRVDSIKCDCWSMNGLASALSCIIRQYTSPSWIVPNNYCIRRLSRPLFTTCQQCRKRTDTRPPIPGKLFLA